MTKYHCTYCRYKFDSKREMPRVCPFCSRERSLSIDKDTASLLSEIDDMT